MLINLTLLLLTTIGAVKTIKPSCPVPTLWKQVAELKCSDVSSYHCLYDVDRHDFVQKCFRASKNPAGSRVIFDTLLNAERCHEDRFQPLPYYSNELNDCIYAKSNCNGEGQITFSNGTFTMDRKCRCDHENGYAFLLPTSDPCFCTPSNEDCSCYLKTCPNSSYVLSSGYKCVLRPITTNECSFPKKRIPPSDGNVKSKKTAEYDSSSYNINMGDGTQKLPVVILAWVTIVFVLLLIAVIQVKDWISRVLESGITELGMEMVDHDLFIVTDGYTDAETALNEYGVVIIKGRYGSGKSAMVLHLALPYFKKGYKTYRFENIDVAALDVLNKKLAQGQNLFIIIENMVSDRLQIRPELKEWKRFLACLFRNRNTIKIIITSYTITEELRHFFLQNIEKDNYRIIDLDNISLARKHKMAILKGYYEKYKRPLNESDIDTIVDCDPVFGFPLMCVLFCSDDNNFVRKKTFFDSPPSKLVDSFENMKYNGINNVLEAIRYSTLVYIAVNEYENSVNLDKDSVDLTMARTIFENVFHRKYSNDVSTIKNEAYKFQGQYLDTTDVDKLRFRHKGIRQAVLITYERVAPAHFIKVAALDDILDITSPIKYKKSANESVVHLSQKDDCYHNLAERIAKEFTKSNFIARKIGSFLRDCGIIWGEVELVKMCLESLKRHTSNYLITAISKQNGQSNVNTNHISCLIDFFYELTDHSISTLPLDWTPTDFRLTWEVITAAKYKNEDTLCQLFTNYQNEGIQNTIMHNVVDEHGNTLLHYIVIWGYDNFVSLITDSVVKNQKPNRFNFVPLFYAAYMGRSLCFCKLLKMSTQKPIKKPREKEKINCENIGAMIKDGLELCGKQVSSENQRMLINKQIVAELSFGNAKQYEEIISSFKLFFPCSINVPDI